MKKTMFITSVIMVVVMAIALTTSSLAWFSAAGSQTVTTNAMTMTANATSAQGLIISANSEAGPWLGKVDLIEGNTLSDMDPALPYMAVSGDTFLDDLVKGSFITNTVDMNGNYSTADPSIGNVSKTLYLTKDLWIASVDTTNDLVVTPSIAWKSKNATTQLYTDTYTYSSSHPIVNVAVLADKNTIVNADRTTGDNSRDWEIVAVFSSSGSSTINYGKGAAFFKSDEEAASVNGSLLQYAATTVATSDPLDKVTIDLSGSTDTEAQDYNPNYGEMLPYGEVKQFKVVAWYDGVSLINGNSNFGIAFTLTFTAATYVAPANP